MANIDNGFRVEVLSLDDNVLVGSGTAPPNTGAGYNAPQGSLYLKSDAGTSGEVYSKFGPNDVDWTLLGASSGGTSIYGSEYQYAENAVVTTTTSTSFITKVSLTTSSLPAGTYRIGLRYGWNTDKKGEDFEGKLLEDTVQLGELHKSETIDEHGSFNTTGSSQRYYENRVFIRILAAGVHTYTFQFRTDKTNKAASTWESTIELWRVS